MKYDGSKDKSKQRRTEGKKEIRKKKQTNMKNNKLTRRNKQMCRKAKCAAQNLINNTVKLKITCCTFSSPKPNRCE